MFHWVKVNVNIKLRKVFVVTLCDCGTVALTVSTCLYLAAST